MTEMEQRREAFAALVQPHLPTLWRLSLSRFMVYGMMCL